MSEDWNPNALVGTHLGTCVLERPLGVGGMGAVYLAQQRRPHRQVAIKLLRPRATADPRDWAVFLARFRREADATAALDHANIVPIYEFGEDGSLAYLVMPYLADGSLATLLAREGPLPVPRAVLYLEQVAAALDFAHRHGIVHRDVKPSNLLLHPDGRLLLADFGIARANDPAGAAYPTDGPRAPADAPVDADAGEQDDISLTQAGVAMGTPEYMAPEQILGEPIGGATDIYALGIVAYAMLTGHTPFAAGDTPRILARQVSEPPRPLRALRADVPPAVERAVLWALAKNPADRPRSAGIFARALRPRDEWSAAGGRSGPVATAAFAGAPSGQPSGRARGESGSRSSGNVYAATGPNDETLSGGFHAGGTPLWPGMGGMGGGTGDARPTGESRKGPILGCLVAVALVVLFAVVLSNVVGGWLSSGGSPTPANGGAPIIHSAATATPTPTPSPTPTPTPPANWLQASPDAIQLGCNGSKKSATVTLANLGPNDVNWTANAQTEQFGGAGVHISPSQGTLKSGDKVKITISNTTHFYGRQGVIYFMPDDSEAGQPAATSYQTQAC